MNELNHTIDLIWMDKPFRQALSRAISSASQDNDGSHFKLLLQDGVDTSPYLYHFDELDISERCISPQDIILFSEASIDKFQETLLNMLVSDDEDISTNAAFAVGWNQGSELISEALGRMKNGNFLRNIELIKVMTKE